MFQLLKHHITLLYTVALCASIPGNIFSNTNASNLENNIKVKVPELRLKPEIVTRSLPVFKSDDNSFLKLGLKPPNLNFARKAMSAEAYYKNLEAATVAQDRTTV